MGWRGEDETDERLSNERSEKQWKFPPEIKSVNEAVLPRQWHIRATTDVAIDAHDSHWLIKSENSSHWAKAPNVPAM